MKTLTIPEYINGIRESNKIVLSRAITLLESTRSEHNKLAREVLEKLMPDTGNSLRIAVTGVPGVGKSTFIEAIGKEILQEGKKVAILAIDPTSQISQGSILGDKTRMEDLSGRADVFIRPSPAGSSLGGVARKTRETILLCEAAGYDTIFIETVGVGQSETAVHSMVDCFLLLMLPGAGDELQGIKRGIMEMANILAINKADGTNVQTAKNAAQAYKNALHLMPSEANNWTVPVVTCSSEKSIDVNKVWEAIKSFENHQKVSGFFNKKRENQALYWFRETIQQHLLLSFFENDSVKEKIVLLEEKIRTGAISSFSAADSILNDFYPNQ